MHKLTQTQLRRHLDGAIEILRPTVTGSYAIEIIIALLILKRASDQIVTPGDVTGGAPVTTQTKNGDRPLPG